MSNLVAVMDLGTNTFHLLIAKPNAENFFNEVLHDYVGVKLGEGGIHEGVIKPDAYNRGVAAMQRFHAHIEQHQVKEVKAIATSAMRSASNGLNFINEVKDITGIQIETIKGDQEAYYIYEGVKASGCVPSDNSLIVDIGGGSVEFILGNQQQIIWKQSFEIGAARLMHKFHQTDPITAASIEALYTYLDGCLPDLFKAVSDHPPTCLIGSSGAFETFAELAELGKGHSFDLKKIRTYSFDKQDIDEVTEKLIHSSHAERVSMPGIIPVRVDMIVVASLLTRYLINKLQINDVIMSTYSLKEGVLSELFKL